MLRLSALICATLFSATLSAQAATVVLFDDTFDADIPPTTSYDTVTSLTNWTVTQGNVDRLGSDFGCTGCIDLDGTGGSDPAVMTTNSALTFVNGVIYNFSLFFSGGTEEERVILSIVGSISALAGNGPSIWSFDVPAGGTFSAPLTLTLGGPANNLGPHLDRVLITYETAAVPLPAGAPLLLAGLGALAAVKRRRARQA